MKKPGDFKMNRCFLAILAAAILLSSCGVKKETIKETPVIDTAKEQKTSDYGVYSDYFAAKFPGKNKELVIQDLSAELTVKKLNDSLRKRLKDSDEQMELAMVEELFSENEKAKPWEKLFNFGMSYSFVGEEFIETLRNSETNDYWTKHPASAGIYRLSRVSYNEKKDRALIYISRWGGKMNGDGEFVLMGKSGEKWSVVTVIYSWVN